MKNIVERAQEIAQEVVEIARQHKKLAIFSIGTTVGKLGKHHRFFPIRYSSNGVSGVANIHTDKEAEEITKAIDGVVDIILVDAERKLENVDIEKIVKKNASKSKVFTIKLNDMTVNAVDSLISQLIDIRDKKIAILGVGNIGSKLALKLVERGAYVCISRRNGEKCKKIANALNIIKPKQTKVKVIDYHDNIKAAKDSDIIIGFTPGVPVVTKKMVESMNQSGIIIDGGLGTIFPDAIELSNKLGIKVLRLDMRAGFSGELVTLLETKNLIENIMGKKTIGEITLVAGGYIGKRGDVIVDNISKPMKVLGIADGIGGLLSDTSEFAFQLKKIKNIVEGIYSNPTKESIY
ncbi:MAG: NAD(P)-binding domain-containing protein [Candidatus Aenigmatarchaeota archaeon]